MNRYWVSWSDCFEDESVARMDSAALSQFAHSVHTHLHDVEGEILRAAVIFNDDYCFSVSCVVEADSGGAALDSAQLALDAALKQANAEADLDDPNGWYLSLLREATVKILGAAA